MATDKLAAADTRTPEQVEIDRLRSELDHFTKSGIIEIAVRNPNVSSWMTEWENRALKAEATISALEAENKRLREARDSQMDYSIDLQRIIEDLCNERDIREPHTTARFHYDMAVRARDLSRNRRETP